MPIPEKVEVKRDAAVGRDAGDDTVTERRVALGERKGLLTAGGEAIEISCGRRVAVFSLDSLLGEKQHMFRGAVTVVLDYLGVIEAGEIGVGGGTEV